MVARGPLLGTGGRGKRKSRDALIPRGLPLLPHFTTMSPLFSEKPKTPQEECVLRSVDGPFCPIRGANGDGPVLGWRPGYASRRWLKLPHPWEVPGRHLDSETARPSCANYHEHTKYHADVEEHHKTHIFDSRNSGRFPLRLWAKAQVSLLPNLNLFTTDDDCR